MNFLSNIDFLHNEEKNLIIEVNEREFIDEINNMFHAADEAIRDCIQKSEHLKKFPHNFLAILINCALSDLIIYNISGFSNNEHKKVVFDSCLNILEDNFKELLESENDNNEAI